MAYFDEMVAAVRDYPIDNVQLEIVEVDVPENALNVNEIGNFRVKVTNIGPLELSGVTLRIKGQNGATVANNGAAAPFVDEFVTQELPTVAGHTGEELTVGSPLKFKAPSEPQDERVLIKATLEDWNASINHILVAHSDPLDTVKATHVNEVLDR
jgi:hypothetical protein